MHRIPRAIAFCGLALIGLAGCITPAKRAKEHAAVFRKLAPADQRLVLRGKLRAGLERDAVLIAWGAPDFKDAQTASKNGKDGKDGTTTEVWIYRQQVTAHAAIGSYDQWQPGNSRTPPGTPLWFSPGYGFGGSGYEGLLLYRPRVQYTDNYVRRAVFVNGKLVTAKSWYGEFAPLP